MHNRSRVTIDPRKAGAEHVGLSPTKHTLLGPSATRGEVLGESHEGRAASH